MKRYRLYLILSGVAILVIILFLYEMSIRYQKPYDQKMFVTFVIQSSGELRATIAGELVQTGRVNPANKILPNASENIFKTDLFKLTRSGVIVAFNNTVEALVVLEPRIRGNKVEWTCAGFPTAAIPKECSEK